MPKDRKHNLAPLSPNEVHEMQIHMAKEVEVSKNNLYITANTVSKTMTAKGIVLLIFFKECLSTYSDDLELSSTVKAILEGFRDVFPEEIPAGLPPIHGIEHQINLVPGSTLPYKPAYRVNLEETKELEKQVKELMDKGYIREP